MFEIAADHQADQRILGRVGDAPFADRRAVAQHEVAVGEGEDFVELVRDEDDALALIAQAANDAVEIVDFLARERGGRLVEDHHLGFLRQRARNFDEVALGRAEALDQHVRI